MTAHNFCSGVDNCCIVKVVENADIYGFSDTFGPCSLKLCTILTDKRMNASFLVTFTFIQGRRFSGNVNWTVHSASQLFSIEVNSAVKNILRYKSKTKKLTNTCHWHGKTMVIWMFLATKIYSTLHSSYLQINLVQWDAAIKSLIFRGLLFFFKWN